ncbi:MAG: hypothetical protein WAO09_07360 [Candidatus Dormiibacterota bacterium]
MPGRPRDPAREIRKVVEAIPEPACFEAIVFLAANVRESYAFAVDLHAALEPLSRDLLEGRLPASHLSVGMTRVARRREERLQIRIFPLEPPPLNRRERRRRLGHRSGR